MRAMAIGPSPVRPYREPHLDHRLTVDAAEITLQFLPLCSTLLWQPPQFFHLARQANGRFVPLTGKRLWASGPWHWSQLSREPSPWAFLGPAFACTLRAFRSVTWSLWQRANNFWMSAGLERKSFWSGGP